ncbi:group 1 glycosyl transferase [Guyparkeria sp. XI15]|nr:group 1 glycosyl transferase [Guyparkeria sp. XI15]OAE86697.1 group 1 glycosyl transferase [Guyparkeria sp. WRN-7]
MRVLMTSTSYPASLEDWKGLFIRHLVWSLADHNQISLSLWAPPGEAHVAVNRIETPKEARFLGDLMDQGGIAHLLRHGGVKRVSAPLRLLAGLRRAYRRTPDTDIYHVNWLQNALPLPDDGKPVVINALGTDIKLLATPLIRKLLRRTLKHHPTTICPNAEWMEAPLKKAFGHLATIQFVPFGIDPAWFQLHQEHRPDTPPRWLAVTRLTRAKLGPLFDWCAPHFDNTSRELHLFGPMQEPIDLPGWVHYHGPASPDALAHKWFPGSRGLITLSQHAEGRPQVMLEAMAAGLPVIASRIPAHENMLKHKETGWLCDSATDVQEGLSYMETKTNWKHMSDSAHRWTANEIGTWNDCAERYAGIYRSMLGMPRHG